MLLKKIPYLLLSLLLLLALPTWAKKRTKEKVAVSTVFEETILHKKGLWLSELGLLGNNSARIQYTDAMRFDANYAPTDGGKPLNLPIDQIKGHTERAHAALKSVMDNQAFTTVLKGVDIKLPIGIKKTVGNKDIVICLDSIVFTPTYAYGVLYVIIEDTKNNKTLAFLGRDIRFTKDGGFTGDARLELLQTYDLNFGQNTTISFLVDQTHENYVVFNCDGFKNLHVDTKVFFSRTMFLPEQTDGTIKAAPARVTTEFKADFESLDNWMVQLSAVPKFQVVGLEGLSFQIGTIAFDYSSTVNPTSIIFPAGYDHSALLTGNRDLWEGFYVKNLVITLPEEFKLKSSSTKRISLQLETALIDKLGFTGKASVTNLFPLTDGNLSNWQYSLDYISIDILKNTPVGASFKGELIMPVTKDTDKFAYTANILPNRNYNFTLTTKTSLSFPLWGAGAVTIAPNSWVKVSLVDKSFIPEASLNGKLSITATINGKNKDNTTTDKGSNLSLAEISFTKLRITTVGAYISLDPNGGAVSFGSPLLEQKMSNLPVSISKVGMITRNDGSQVGISFTVKVNLVGESENGGGFSGNAAIIVWGELEAATKKLSYYKTELGRIELNNIDIAVMSLSGFIEFYREDPVYGSGFSGGIQLSIDLKASKIGVEVRCIFGKKPLLNKPDEIYRYWAVDALVELPSITLFPPLIFLNAFGGGANYRMGMQTNPMPNAKFVSNSGVAYLPDETKGLGLKAMIGIQGASRKLYEGQIIFEIQFNINGGVSLIAFSGYVQIASLGKFDKLAKLKSSVGGFVSAANKAGAGSVHATSASSNSQVYGEIAKMGDGGALLAQWRMVMDFDNSAFSANIDVFVDVFSVIKGRNQYNHAGRIDILFNKSEWHVFVGRPDYAMGLNLIDVVDLSGYFMMGKNLPTPLAMPNGKRASFPTVPVDGMGMGARIHIGKNGGGSFYYSVGLDAGFDFLIWNVEGQYCNGKAKGVKGWYSAGQVFLYGRAAAGLKTCVHIPYPCNCGWGCCFKVFGKRICPCPVCDWCKTNSCINVTAELTVDISAQIEAPNPTYFEATIKILGMGIDIKGGKRCN